MMPEELFLKLDNAMTEVSRRCDALEEQLSDRVIRMECLKIVADLAKAGALSSDPETPAQGCVVPRQELVEAAQELADFIFGTAAPSVRP